MSIHNYDKNPVVTVRIQNVAPYWNGKFGILNRWIHDDWYVVVCEGRELLLNMSKNEFIRV